MGTPYGNLQRNAAWLGLVLFAAGAAAWLFVPPQGRATGTGSSKPLHYTVNHSKDFPNAAAIGFNLADVSSVASLDALPEGAKGILWMRNGYNQTCSWQLDDAKVAEVAREARDHPKFSGIYFISDTPHPSICPDAAAKLAKRTALIHQNDPNGLTFIAVSGGYKFPKEFEQLADSADLIGVVVYPCNMKKETCELDKIAERVNRALDADIPKERLVPVFQAFGQACTTNETPYYQLPTAADMHEILAIWDELLPPTTRPFDMTYSWGGQDRHACPSLSMAGGGDYPDLKSIYADYFGNM